MRGGGGGARGEGEEHLRMEGAASGGCKDGAGQICGKGGGAGQIRTRWKAAPEEEERDGGGGGRERDGGVEKGW
jgi:hypothetical protein